MPTRHLHVLFVCSMNKWRSPTAEQVYRGTPNVDVRSRGTSPRARQTISADDIRWADILFAMESKHKDRLLAAFPWLIRFKEICVLHIPDNYKYMDPHLIEELRNAIGDLADRPV